MRPPTTTAKLVSLVALDGRDEAALLALAAGATERMDAHLAAAIRESAREGNVEPPVDGQSIMIATSARFRELGISTERVGDWPERLRNQGQDVLFVAVDGRMAGVLGFAAVDADVFPTRPDGLPAASATQVVELAAGGEFDLRIAPVSKQLGEANVRMLAYNGSVPGPTLRVRQGSELVVNVVNDGDLETTVHWHGLRLDNRYDGTAATQQPIPVGGHYSYRPTFPDPGAYWYHPHVREDYTQEAGLYGTIIVSPSDPEYWPEVDRELAVTLDDVLVEDGSIAPFNRQHPTFTAMGRFGNVLLITGERSLSLAAHLGEVVRFYFTNTANARVFNVSIPGARMKLVGGDSGRYERETFAEAVLIAPSERAIVDVLFDRPGELMLEHRTPDRIYALGRIAVSPDRIDSSSAAAFATLRTNDDFATDRGRMDDYLAAFPDKTLALVAEINLDESRDHDGSPTEYVCPMHPDVRSDHPGRCPQCSMKLLPAHLVGDGGGAEHHEHTHHGGHGHEAPPGSAGIEWEDDMLDVNRMTTPTNTRWKLIDRDTGAEGSAIKWRFRVNDRVKIRLVNEMDSDHPMQHPFHVHGAGRFLILSRDGVVEPNLVWKDTVLVRTGETVDLLLDVTNPGTWMAHCHIAEHHESGMMLRFTVDE
jgi:FtsP/CotA-like multicopper oxidase with cupredoxin domain